MGYSDFFMVVYFFISVKKYGINVGEVQNLGDVAQP